MRQRLGSVRIRFRLLDRDRRRHLAILDRYKLGSLVPMHIGLSFRPAFLLPNLIRPLANSLFDVVHDLSCSPPLRIA